MTSGSTISCESSPKRLSICPTSPSMTSVSATASSGDDLEAHEVLGAGLAGALDLEHGVHGGDRDGELREVRLTRRQALELHAGPHEHLGPAVPAVLAEELDDLEGQARD